MFVIVPVIFRAWLSCLAGSSFVHTMVSSVSFLPRLSLSLSLSLSASTPWFNSIIFNSIQLCSSCSAVDNTDSAGCVVSTCVFRLLVGLAIVSPHFQGFVPRRDLVAPVGDCLARGNLVKVLHGCSMSIRKNKRHHCLARFPYRKCVMDGPHLFCVGLDIPNRLLCLHETRNGVFCKARVIPNGL